MSFFNKASEFMVVIYQTDGSRLKKSGGGSLSCSSKAFTSVTVWTHDGIITLLWLICAFIASVYKTSCSWRSVHLSPLGVTVRNVSKNAPYLSPHSLLHQSRDILRLSFFRSVSFVFLRTLSHEKKGRSFENQ